MRKIEHLLLHETFDLGAIHERVQPKIGILNLPKTLNFVSSIAA